MRLNQTKQKPFSLPHILLLILLLLVIGAIIWLFAGQKKGNPAYESTSLVMGTYMQQTIYGSGGEEAAAAASQAVANLENRISWRKEDSDIAKLNANAGKDWITVDDSTLSMLEQCLDVAEQSNGAYDPTILPLSSLWDFGGENQHLPDRDEVERFASYVDYQILRIDMEQKEASLKNSLYALDLGGAGKGAPATRRCSPMVSPGYPAPLWPWGAAWASMVKSPIAPTGGWPFATRSRIWRNSKTLPWVRWTFIAVLCLPPGCTRNTLSRTASFTTTFWIPVPATR